MELLIEIIVAFFATIAFAILYHVPSKHWLLCGTTGSIGWFFYELFHLSYGVVIATFIAVLFVTLFARFFSAMKKTPVTLFLVSGIFPLVPGVGIYYTSYYFFMSDFAQAGAKGIETLKLAIAIALGIICIFSIPQKVFRIFEKFFSKPAD